MGAPLETRGLSLFSDLGLGLADDKSGRVPTRPWGSAILEARDELPTKEDLDMVFEGLTTLSPRRFAALLQQHQGERLFLVFADRHKHARRASQY
ncbi:hypothetical protein J2W42_005353 [Rhizobium tibeticum]|uniref:type IV toxin-antitoxin system AbiEi family antitoxin domain-containing protein n=1 Tax=Rhizobium tibeticum TaxID=501024 RepID=UPI002789511C|nr:type IV toxin-antitoxin system AbiEi family antitoxin domain-containing protein [Rhizobium tibeticum]MDP9812483.1 hypothetical protein [Rhizobium tibeticum]